MSRRSINPKYIMRAKKAATKNVDPVVFSEANFNNSRKEDTPGAVEAEIIGTFKQIHIKFSGSIVFEEELLIPELEYIYNTDTKIIIISNPKRKTFEGSFHLFYYWGTIRNIVRFDVFGYKNSRIKFKKSLSEYTSFNTNESTWDKNSDTYENIDYNKARKGHLRNSNIKIKVNGGDSHETNSKVSKLLNRQKKKKYFNMVDHRIPSSFKKSNNKENFCLNCVYKFSDNLCSLYRIPIRSTYVCNSFSRNLESLNDKKENGEIKWGNEPGWGDITIDEL